jgi:hypothetical protein
VSRLRRSKSSDDVADAESVDENAAAAFAAADVAPPVAEVPPPVADEPLPPVAEPEPAWAESLPPSGEALAERPEALVGAAFAGGVVFALILKRLAR